MRPLVLAMASLLLLGGCGGSSGVVRLPTTLTGARVGELAEQQLEVEHPHMAAGRFSCPDLRLTVGRQVRCVQTAQLSGGRQIQIRATVRVTSLSDGGRLRVRTEDHVFAYAVTGGHLATELRARTAKLYRLRPDKVRCPALTGRVGARVRCTVEVGKSKLIAPVRATACDPSSYTTRYAFSPTLFPRRLNPGLPTLLKLARHGGLGS